MPRDHDHGDHLEALINVCSTAVEDVPVLPTTRVLIIAAEPCGCHVIGGTPGHHEEIIRLLLHAAQCVAMEHGERLEVEHVYASDGNHSTGPAG